MKHFACGDVVPGCTRTFTESSDDRVLAAVARHAAADHGVAAPTAELVSAVRAHIRAA
jgi:predicted small metal-binding protein